MKTTIRSLLQMFAFATVALAAATQASAQDIRFKATSIYNNAEPNNASGRIIVYNLPAAGVGSGAVDTFFDVRAQIVSGATPQQVAGYGLIMELGGAGGVTFTTPDPVVAGTNNMDPVVFGTQNAGLSVILGETNVDGSPAGNQSIGVIGLHPTANANTALANNDGLFRVPIRVAPGFTTTAPEHLALSMGVRGNTYSGFAQSDGTLLTGAGAFDANNIIEVRQSKKGDMDGNLALDAQDITPFINALSDIGAYQAARPWLRASYIADTNGSGTIDAQDITPFINILAGGGGSPSAVPEPSTVVLGALGFAGLLLGRRYRRK